MAPKIVEGSHYLFNSFLITRYKFENLQKNEKIELHIILHTSYKEKLEI